MRSLIAQLFKFMKVYRKYWMAPVLFGLLALGALLIALEGSVLGPFIYALF